VEGGRVELICLVVHISLSTWHILSLPIWCDRGERPMPEGQRDPGISKKDRGWKTPVREIAVMVAGCSNALLRLGAPIRRVEVASEGAVVQP
jgi:hypothetical protein